MQQILIKCRVYGILFVFFLIVFMCSDGCNLFEYSPNLNDTKKDLNAKSIAQLTGMMYANPDSFKFAFIADTHIFSMRLGRLIKMTIFSLLFMVAILPIMAFRRSIRWLLKSFPNPGNRFLQPSATTIVFRMENIFSNRCSAIHFIRLS